MIEILLLSAAVLAACGVIYRTIIRPIVRAGRVIHETYETVRGYDTRLDAVETRSAQLINNGGSSLKDAVDRIEVSQAESKLSFDNHIEWSQAELLKVWQNLASRDAVEAAVRTAEMLNVERGTKHD